MKNKGFTLIELLAVLAILGVIMLIAVPSVSSILSKNKQSTYIEDAKQLISEAKYKFTVDMKIPKPNSGSAILIPLSCVSGSELDKGPENGTYSADYSYVIIQNYNDQFNYYVQIAEGITRQDSTVYVGLKLTSEKTLNDGEGYSVYTSTGDGLQVKNTSASASYKFFSGGSVGGTIYATLPEVCY